MKKIITMTHFDRPMYTDMCLRHLSLCKGISEYSIICYVEPSETDVSSILYLYKRLLNLTIVENKERRFNSKNVYAAMKHGFEEANYIIHIEDDIILSKDALQFFEWCRDKRDDNIINVCSYVRRTHEEDCHIWSSYHEINKRRWFVPWGWATWKDVFDKMTELNVWDDNPGFDNNINNIMRGYEIYPHVSRSQNVGGLRGFHIENARWHYMNHFTPLWIESFDLIKHYLPKNEWFIK